MLPEESGTNNDAPIWAAQLPPDAKILLYLGRIHPKKNLTALIQAWERWRRDSRGSDWWLVIAGWDQGGYQKRLLELAETEAASRVLFVGPQFGNAKASAFAYSDAFVLPSLSEGLPMVVLEAWSNGLPVLMTRECNLPIGFEAGAALEIGATPEGIATGLAELLACDDADRESMGQHGRRLVELQFKWTEMARRMSSVYRWLLGEGPRPDCIFLD
jgi:poly(glycerol-phosphate) alpha-glucosyltransferase